MKLIHTLRHSLAASALLFVATAHAAEPKTPGEKLLTEFFTKVWNQPQDLKAIDEICTEDFILTTSGKDVVGRVAFKEWVKSFGGKVRDLRLTILETFSSADGSRVVGRWRVNGFNRGMFGTPANDEPVEFTGIAIFEVRNGKLAHNWVERSAYELMQRLQKNAK